MAAIAPEAAGHRVSIRDDVRDVATTILTGTAAGALAGLAVGGIGGRLVMLLLRVLSDPVVVGVTSDDGFEIGVVTLGGSFQLAGAMAALGTANGVLYVVLRQAIPPKARAPLWSLFGAAVGGSQFVHDDGVDFTLLEPRWLAVASFVALPGLAALVVVVLVERWLGDAGRRPRPALLALAALTGTVALVLSAAATVVVLAVRRLGLARWVAAVGRAIVPAALVLGIVAGAWHVVAEAAQILG